MRLIGLLVGWLFVCVSISSAAEYYVSPAGRFNNPGTRTRPLDLATALGATTSIRPGDTIWLQGGTYRGGFKSSLVGLPTKPITVRGVPGERVTIDTTPRDARDDGLLMLLGADVIFRDFEVLSSALQRETKIAGPWPEDINRGSIELRGDRLKAINLVVHDLQGGFGMWAHGEGGEISGCLIYNNGWRGPDRSHGHGIYAQNARGTKRIANNIIFHQFGYGVHVYGSEKAELKGFEIESNIAFANGCWNQKDDFAPGIFVGGGSPVTQLLVANNLVVNGGIRLGYPWGGVNRDVECRGNYADRGLVVRDFQQAKVTENTIEAESNAVTLEAAEKVLVEGHAWSKNRYFVTDGKWGDFVILAANKGRTLTFPQWQSETKLDADSQFTKGPANKTGVIIQPNAYEPGRAHLAVFNPRGLTEMPVDLGGVLKAGQSYRIVNAKDYFGPPILSGVYAGGVVQLPLLASHTPKPIGLPEATPPNSEPQFACFVLLPLAEKSK
jgi:hypothetical protein